MITTSSKKLKLNTIFTSFQTKHIYCDGNAQSHLRLYLAICELSRSIISLTEVTVADPVGNLTSDT